MGKSTAFSNDWLKLIFNGTPIPGLADNTVSSPLTQLFVALHVADPGPSGTEATNEISYTGYARVPVARTSAAWSVIGNAVTPVNPIIFNPSSGGTGGDATFWSVGVAVSGATMVLYSGAITPGIQVNPGVTPELATGTNISES